MGLTVYKVQDPSGNMREIEGPEGATDEEVISQAQKLFSSTPGGAATGNPNIQRQGAKSLRNDLPSTSDALTRVGSATGLGALTGAFAPEILTGLGGAASVFPPTAPAAPFLLGAGSALRGQRLLSAGSGAVSGAASSIAGIGAEAAGASPGTTTAVELAAGGITPEFKSLAGSLIKKVAGIPAISDAVAAVRKYVGKEGTLNEAQEKYVREQIELIRGGPKSDGPLKSVGEAMGESATQGAAKAGDTVAAAGMMNPGSLAGARNREFADIGDELRGVIVKRNEEGLAKRKADYAANEKARDAIVAQQEGQSRYVRNLPEYQKLIDELKADLGPGKRSPSVQAGIQKMIAELDNPQTSFQALDDVRRKLGEAFRGKPAEGYDAIGEGMAKDLYGKVSELQKKYAGAPQAKLLDDYAAQTEGLEIFRSKTGAKATAVDKYRDTEFSTDSSTLPKAYFKSRAGVKSLQELTGNTTLVNQAALDYTGRELKDANAGEVRAFMTKNSEWLSELPFVRKSLGDHATKLESAERATAGAADFSKQAASNSKLLMGSHFPAQRAVDLVRRGDEQLWTAAGTAINNSPQAKTQVLDAVKQVVADQARNKETLNLFNRSIRPGMEKSGLASKQELDFIAERLDNIQKLNIPEAQKLGMVKRILLNAANGWTASNAGEAAAWSKNKLVPD